MARSFQPRGKSARAAEALKKASEGFNLKAVRRYGESHRLEYSMARLRFIRGAVMKASPLD